VELVDLLSLAAQSDFVTLHAPLTDETRGLVDEAVLAHTRRGAILVNLARGGLIRSLGDVLAALEAGILDGVGLDVFEQEPPDLSHPLFRDPRVLLSPHALGLSRHGRERLFEEMSRGMAAVLRGERAPSVANPEVYGLTRGV
jgi:phosphoglycerate dehydrogenase-like enzyme